MVLRHGHCAFWHFRSEGGITMAGTLKTFWIGFTAGFITAVIIFGIIFALRFFNQRDREILQYAEQQMEIEALREDYSNRDPVEFLETIPDVRGAADGASADFIRKRDEAVQRFRNRLAD